MVTLESDQPVPDTEHAVVAGGDYDEVALVQCYLLSDPDRTPIARFFALFIATGAQP
jgi:hypothetical protein